MPPKKRRAKRKKRKIDEAVAASIQAKLKAACTQDSPLKFFSRFDKDKSGLLSAEELRAILSRGPNPMLSEAEIDEVIREFDANGDGQLSIEEFARATASMSDEEGEAPPSIGSRRCARECCLHSWTLCGRAKIAKILRREDEPKLQLRAKAKPCEPKRRPSNSQRRRRWRRWRRET